MPNPIAVRFGTSTAQEEAHERLEALLKQAKGYNGIQGMGTLIREIVIKYLPLAEQELIPFAGRPAPVYESDDNIPSSLSSISVSMTEEDSMIISMPEDW